MRASSITANIKKGWVLIGVSALVMVSFSLNLSVHLKDALPMDSSKVDMAAIRSALQQMMATPRRISGFQSVHVGPVGLFGGGRFRRCLGASGQ